MLQETPLKVSRYTRVELTFFRLNHIEKPHFTFLRPWTELVPFSIVIFHKMSGRSAVVARSSGGRKVAGSIPVGPTIFLFVSYLPERSCPFRRHGLHFFHAEVMVIVGHSRTSTTDEYLRIAGIELKGSTDSLSYLLPKQRLENIIPLRIS